MLRIHTGKTAKAAKAYFEKGLAREDYYAEGREVVGRWYGLGAKKLGLEGVVEREAFHALCDNRHPSTGEKLTPRDKVNRRVGFDISFSVPKSVSIHQAVTGSKEILGAFHEAMRETMAEMEREAETRVRKGGANANRTTGNLTWAEFTHYNARPVGGTADPHLHAHCWTFNATFDPVEQRWKALELEQIWRKAPTYQAAFDCRLAEKLNQLGYETVRSANGFELAAYSRAVIERFSRRTQQIEDAAAARGIENAQEKAGLGAKTREPKGEGQDEAAQRQEWAARLSLDERTMIRNLESTRQPQRSPQPPRDASRLAGKAVDQAVAHCFERQSVVSAAELSAEALRFATSEVGVAPVAAEIARRQASGALLTAELDGALHVSTPVVLAEERRMTAWARDGRGTQRPLGSAPEAKQSALEALMASGRHPDSHQLAAIDHVLDSKDRVMVIRGRAGTGKTTVMRAAHAGIMSGGKEVFFFAPGAEASRGVLEGEGFTGATTVAKLLQDTSLQERLRGQVIWVDEAGTLGARDMTRLFDVAEAAEARIVLSGDVHQHAPVARGDALRVLESEAGLAPSELTTVYRQTLTAYREAVEAISRGDACGAREGFEQLDAMGAVHEVEDEDRYAALAESYLKTVLEDSKTAAVVSPTHAEGAKVTDAIRAGLRDAGRISEDERSFTRLKSLGLTAAERTDARQYDKGLVVQSHGRVAGLKRGVPYAIAEVDGPDVWLAQEGWGLDGPRTRLPLSEAEKFEVLERDRLGLAKGDLIRITRNGMANSRGPGGRKQELRNGAQYEIAGFTKAGDLDCVGRDGRGRITSRVVIDRAFGNLTHGYCVTSHSAQGKTVDRVFVAQNAAAFRANNREQFYVSVSRGREGIAIFTDDKEALKSQISASAARISATTLSRARDLEGARQRDRQARSASRVLEEAREYARRRASEIVALFASPRRERTLDGPQRGI